MSPRLLEGEIAPDRESNEPDVIASLHRENRDLRQELFIAKQEVTRARAEAAEAVAALRPLQRQLAPLYKALQGVFGEIEHIVGADGASQGNGGDPRVVAVWASWKTKLGATVAKGIDALMVHGELDTQQLAIAAGLDKRTITNTVIYKLNQAGLINKNGGRFSLKAL